MSRSRPNVELVVFDFDGTILDTEWPHFVAVRDTFDSFGLELSLDAWQRKAAAFSGHDYQIPILHLAQLLGAAAGIEESELKFKRHVTRLSPEVKAKLKVPSAVGTGTGV